MAKRRNSKEPLSVIDAVNIDQNPISQYNHVVFHYNDRINIKNGITLDLAYNDKMYRF